MLQRSAASMAAANTSFEQTIALGTAANAVIQNPDKVGTAMSTMAMRLRGSTAQLEDAGEEIDEFCTSTSKMQEQVKALTGVDIMKSATEYKSVYEIMREISEVYDQMSDVNRASLLEAMFGKRNANVGTAILSNFDIAKQVLSDLSDGTAEGYTEETYDKYLDSVTGKMARMEAAYQSFSSSFLDSSLIGMAYDTGSGLLGFLTSATELLGSIPTLAGVAITALTRMSNLKFFRMESGQLTTYFSRNKAKAETDYQNAVLWAQKYPNGEGDISGLSDTYQQAALNAQQTADGTRDIAQAFAEAHDNAKKNVTVVGQLKSGIKGIGSNLVSMLGNLVMMGIQMAAIAGITALIQTGWDWFDKNVINRVKYAKEGLTELKSAWQETAEANKQANDVVKEYGDDFNRLQSGVDEKTGRNVSLSEDDYQRYLDASAAIAQSEIANVNGVTIAYNEQGQAMAMLTGQCGSLAEAYAELEAKARREILDKADEAQQNWKTVYDDEEKRVRSSYETIGTDLQDSIADVSWFAKTFGVTIDEWSRRGTKGYQSDIDQYIKRLQDYAPIEAVGELQAIRNDVTAAYEANPDISFDKYQTRLQAWVNKWMDSIGTAAEQAIDKTVDSSLDNFTMRTLSKAAWEDKWAEELKNEEGSFSEMAQDQQVALKTMMLNAIGGLGSEYFSDVLASGDVKDAIVDDFFVPLTDEASRNALMALNDTTAKFNAEDKETTYKEYTEARTALTQAMNVAGFAEQAEQLVDIFDGNQDKFATRVAYARNIVAAEDEWFNNLTASQLAYLQTIDQVDTKITPEQFAQQYAEYMQTQQTSVSALTSAWESVSKKQDEAVKALNAQDKNGGVLTQSDYSGLIAANPLYAQSLRVGANGLEIDQQALNAQLSKERQDIIEQNNTALEKNYRELNKMTDELADMSGKSKEEISAKKQAIETLKKEIINRELLNNELKFADTPLGQWYQASEQGEAGDTFRDLKSAMDTIKEGIKSGRTQTNKYRAAGDLIFGPDSGWQDWTKNQRQKAYDQASKLYTSDGQLNMKEFRRQAQKAGIVEGKDNTFVQGMTVEQMAKAMGYSPQFMAQALKAASEYEGVDVSYLNDQIESLIPKSEVDTNTSAVVNNTGAVEGLTAALNAFTGKLGGDYHGGNVSFDPKTRNRVAVTKDNIDILNNDWNANAALGDTVTHVSQAESFKKKNGEQFTVSYTPITPDGRVLSKDTVNQYFEDLFSKSGDNIAQIIANDAKSNGGYGLIEAIFTGDNQELNSDYFGQMIHNIFETALAEEGNVPEIAVDVKTTEAESALSKLFALYSTLNVTVRYVDADGNLISSSESEDNDVLKERKPPKKKITAATPDEDWANANAAAEIAKQAQVAEAASAISEYYDVFNRRLTNQNAEIQKKQEEAEAQKRALDSAAASEAEDKEAAQTSPKQAVRKAAQSKQDQFWAAQKERYANLDEDQGSYASGALDGLKDAQRNSALRQGRSENALTAKVQEIQDKIVEAYLSGAEGFDDRINDYQNDIKLQGQLSDAGLDFGQIIKDAIDAAIAKSKAPAEESAELDTSAAEAQNEALDNEIEEPATKPVEANTASAQAASEALHTSLSSPVTIPVSLSVSGGGLPFGAAMKYKGFASGTSNAPDGPSLVGEAGPEIVVDMKRGRWHLAKGPEIRNLNKGDIVYNAKQTQDILRGKGGAKAALGGNSYANSKNAPTINYKGSRNFGKLKENDLFDTKTIVNVLTTGNITGTLGDGHTGGNGGGGGGGGGASASDMQKKFSKLYDWIEIALKVAQKRTQKLIKLANQQIGWRKKNQGLDDAIKANNDELKTNEKAAKRYQQQADKTAKKYKLSAKYIEKIKNGEIDIESLDDKTKAKVNEYKKWYDKAQDCLETVEELKEQEKELNLQRLTNIQEDYEAWIGYYQKIADVAESTRKKLRATGKKVTRDDYYETKTQYQWTNPTGSFFGLRLTSSTVNQLKGEDELAKMIEERKNLQAEFDSLIKSGAIKYGDEQWLEWNTRLKALDATIADTTADIAELKEEAERLDLEDLKKAMAAIQQIAQETENLMNLHEAQGTDQIEDYYVDLIRNGDEQIANLQAQRDELIRIQQTFEEGSDKWEEYEEDIRNCNNEIWSAMANQERWNDAIADLQIKKLQDQRKELEKTNDAYDKQLEYEKALQDLERAKNQKNILVYREGRIMPLCIAICIETSEDIGQSPTG